MILEQTRDGQDTWWLQIYASYLVRRGSTSEATDYLLKAVELLPDPDLLKKTAEVAYSADRLDDAVTSLESSLRLDPGDIAARQRLAFLYLEKHDYQASAQQFLVLSERQPSELTHRLNAAVSFMHSGDAEAALDSFDQVCRTPDAPVQAFVGRSKVLRSLGRVSEAYDSLLAVKDRFWDDQAFLMQLQQVAFAAQKESVGHEAFVHLRKLQETGRAEADVLRAMSVDDFMKDAEVWRKQDDENHRQVLQGKTPWMLADRLSGSVSYWGWAVRTQPLPYVYDDPVNRERHSVYSTNGFYVRMDGEEGSSIEPLECPPQNTAVAIDQSALITLHQLGLMDKTAAYFGRIYIPSAYLSQVLSESGELVLHQLSQKTSLEEIKAALDSDRIGVLAGSRRKGMAFVHEHTMDEEDDRHYYRIRDLAAALRKGGLITDHDLTRIASVAHKPAAADSRHPELKANQSIQVELSTLKTLCSEEMLDLVLATFSVHITAKDKAEVIAGLRSFEVQERIRGWHGDLWDKVRKDSRFIQATYVTPPEFTDRGHDRYEPSDLVLSLASCTLAAQMGIPLLADDRILQNHILRQRNHEWHAAFGTDNLLSALADAGMIDESEYADHLKQLTDWRYRFIVVPSQVMKTLAAGFMASVPGIPGQPLRDIACYAHDCMEDAGLFGGLEPTSPPTSMAFTLFRAWLDSVIDFVVEMWKDERFDIPSLRSLTNWAFGELLPSLPRSLGEPQRTRVASFVERMVFRTAILASYQIGDAERANSFLTAISEALGIGGERYLDIVTGIIDDIRI